MSGSRESAGPPSSPCPDMAVPSKEIDEGNTLQNWLGAPLKSTSPQPEMEKSVPLRRNREQSTAPQPQTGISMRDVTQEVQEEMQHPRIIPLGVFNEEERYQFILNLGTQFRCSLSDIDVVIAQNDERHYMAMVVEGNKDRSNDWPGGVGKLLRGEYAADRTSAYKALLHELEKRWRLEAHHQKPSEEEKPTQAARKEL